MHADSAFHVALAGGRAFFGSSVTDEMCAIDVVPKTVSPGEAEAPLVNFVEILCSHR